ncbi:MAG: FAD-dependent oxidoreductase [Cyanobacteriota bacterium]
MTESSTPLCGAEPQQVPIVVWGGGSGGVAAAIQAARAGVRTLLLTPGPWLGGMVSAAGVCAPDGNELSPWQTGIWGALLRELRRQEPEGLDHNWVSCFGYRPASAEAILRRWAREAGLSWWPDCRLLAVERQGDRIEALRVERLGHRSSVQHHLHLEVLIDGSDLGDLLPLADTPHRLGWESRESWSEPSAPPLEALQSDPFFKEQPVQSPTWVAIARMGQGPCPEGHPLTQPFAGATERFGLETTLVYGRLPGDLLMLNWPLHGNDWPQGLQRAFGTVAERTELEKEMREHSRHFRRALQGASGGWLQPARLFPDRAQASQGDLEGDQELALMPYWREGRRLIGRALVREQDLLPGAAGISQAPLPCDSDGEVTAIAVGNYANDHHYPGPDWPLAAKSCRWGGRWTGTPFCIPYGALISETVVNLLMADKAISTTHIANGATRLQPLVLNVGQAAGLAAALAVQQRIPPSELAIRPLQEALIDDPQAPAAPVPLWDTPWHHPRWAERVKAVLDAPERLNRENEILEFAGLEPPPEPGEQLLEGPFEPDGHGGGVLQTGQRRWPVITLEPALHQIFLRLDRPQSLRLWGCLNPWGPWLRATRLAQ